jgi:hypothetical protein
VKFTPERQRKIVALLRSGLPRATVCMLAGVSRSQFYLVLNQNRTFRTAIKRAEGAVERRWMGLIERAARDPKHWTAAAWLMERRWPEKYALRMARMIEAEREAMLSELRKSVDEKTFVEVARALVVAQQNARGRGRERSVSTH